MGTLGELGYYLVERKPGKPLMRRGETLEYLTRSSLLGKKKYRKRKPGTDDEKILRRIARLSKRRVKQRRTGEKRLEGSIEHSCVKHAKEQGNLSRKMNGLGFNAWPDRQFLPRERPMRKQYGRVVPSLWVEFKRVGQQPTPAQAELHRQLRRAGQQVYVCDSLSSFKRILKVYNDGHV